MNKSLVTYNDPDQGSTSCCMKIFHAFWLCMCILGGGLIGPMTNVVPAKGLWLKNTWRIGPVIIIMYVL